MKIFILCVYLLFGKAPDWYEQLRQDQKDNIQNIIGDAKCSDIALEKKLMDETGVTRDDLIHLLKWWFSLKKVKVLFSKSCQITF